jgi:hypothetical protein
MEALIPLLASAAEEVPGLVEQIPTLTESASHDFSGLSGKIKMVRHMNALRASSMQLKNAGTGAVRALNNLRRIVSMVHP